MMTSNPGTPAAQPEDFRIAHAKKQALAMRLRKTMALADRVHVMADGSRRIVRFNPVEIVEHWIVVIAFTVLALTGLMQRYAGIDAIAWAINKVFGGFEAVRTVHQAAAILFGAISLFHLGTILTTWFVKHEQGSMFPSSDDGADLVKMLQYNLGIIKQRPKFDRFTIEQKLGYWALLIFVPIMFLTGLTQWFPTVVTRLLPGQVVLLAQSIHGLTAILGVASVLTWHLYFTVIKERNTSIFTGLMSEQAMKESHPLELERLIAAHDEIRKISKGN